jgi:hypothetical protein
MAIRDLMIVIMLMSESNRRMIGAQKRQFDNRRKKCPQYFDRKAAAIRIHMNQTRRKTFLEIVGDSGNLKFKIRNIILFHEALISLCKSLFSKKNCHFYFSHTSQNTVLYGHFHAFQFISPITYFFKLFQININLGMPS